MAGSAELLGARRPSRSRLGRRVGGFLRAAWRAYWQRQARRAAAELLRRLDDRALRDIGISRNEIDCEVYGDAPDGVRR
jgi:uncharacterized protein YjiS (DUF1127 family)